MPKWTGTTETTIDSWRREENLYEIAHDRVIVWKKGQQPRLPESHDRMNDGMGAVIRDLQTLLDEGMHGVHTDAQLLDEFVVHGGEGAFAALVQRHGAMVWGVSRRILRDHHDAEDAFQATFLVLARRAAAIVPREKLGNWLYGVAHQTALKARAMRARRRGRERPMPVLPVAEAVREEPLDDRFWRLDRELNSLPEKYRAPIVLCELEGRTHQQAAEQLGWPVGTLSGASRGHGPCWPDDCRGTGRCSRSAPGGDVRS